MQEILISNDNSLLDKRYTYSVITESYWAKGIPEDLFLKSLENSLCFGIYKNQIQIGFARVISDYATFAYLGDLFIDESQQGKGYSKNLLDEIMAHPRLQGLRRFCLGTKDAQELYEKYGFRYLENSDNWMEIKDANKYKEKRNE